MRRPSRTAVTAAVVAGVVGLGVGWLGAARPWEEGPPGPEGAADLSGSVALVDLGTTPDEGYRYRRTWSDGSTLLTLTPSGKDLVVGLDRDRLSDSPGWRFTPARTTTPEAVAALPGSTEGPWVAIGSRTRGTPVLQSWSAPRTGRTASEGEQLPDPTSARLPASPVETASSESILTSDVAVAEVGGRAAAVAIYHQGREGSSRPRTEGITMCPSAGECTWGDELPTPDGTEPVAIASAGSGFVLVTDAPGMPVWFADDARLTWHRVGQAPAGATLEHTVDGSDGAFLLWRTTSDATDSTTTTPDHVIVQRSSGDDPLETVVGRLALPDDALRITTIARVGSEWLLGGSAREPAWTSMRYSPGRAMILRPGESAWQDITPQVLRHQPDQSVEAFYLSSDRERMIALGSAVQRTSSTWRWRPTPEDD